MELYGGTLGSEPSFSTQFCSPTGIAYPEISPDVCHFENWDSNPTIIFRFNFVVLGYFNFAFILYPAFAGSSTQGDWLRSLVFANLAD